MTTEEVSLKNFEKYMYQGLKQHKYQKDKQDKEKALWKKEHCTSKAEYAKYLLNKKWLNRRDYILNLRGAKCMNCGSTIKLNIHHLKYTGKYPWLAPDEDLICLCEKCHKEIHSDEVTALNTTSAYKLIEVFNNKEVDENVVLCFKGAKFVGKYDIEEAAEMYNTKVDFIKRCCDGNTKSCAGHIWKYNK